MLIMRELPEVIRKLYEKAGKKESDWHLHVDNNPMYSFCCVKAPNVHHESVWVFFSTFEIPCQFAKDDLLYGQRYDIMFLGETDQHADQIWKRFSANAKRWSNEKVQSQPRLFQCILTEITDFAYTKKEADNFLNEIYNKSFERPDEVGVKEGEVGKYDICVFPMKTNNEISDLHYLSGYEREMRFYHPGAWDYVVSRKYKAKYKTVYIAYLTKHGSKEDPVPVGYIAALDGDWALVRSKFKFMKPECLKIISFAVIPKMRRKKVATLLFQKLLFDRKEKKSIETVIEFDNIDALNFMSSLKFRAPEVSESGEHIIWNESNPESLLLD